MIHRVPARRIRPNILLWVVLLLAGSLHAENRPQAQVPQSTQSRDLATLHALLGAQQPVTWVFTGDSVTEGAKWTAGARDYSELFSERVRWEMRRGHDIVINTAISGDKTDDILQDFAWRVAHLHPNVVSLMIGMNDSGWGSEREPVFETNLRELIRKIRATGAIPILQTTNWTLDDSHRRDLPAYNAIIRDVAASEAGI